MKKVFFVLLLAGITHIAGAQNRESLIGCWTMPTYHGDERLSLMRNNSFSFNDWNDRRRDYDMLSGRWSFEGGSRVTLYYKDRTKQSFTVRRDRRGRWMLSKVGGFQLMKADPADCRM